MSPGEKRRRKAKREREDAARRVIVAGLRAAGASCATCAHCGHYPGDARRTCIIDSDFEGYTIVSPDDLCFQHSLAKELVKP
jgi:hypothetical protein